MYEDLITILPLPVFRVPSPTNQNLILVERKPITVIIIIFAFVRPIRIHSWLSENQSPSSSSSSSSLLIVFKIRIHSWLSENQSPSSSSSLVSGQSESVLGLARTNHHHHHHLLFLVTLFRVRPIRNQSWLSENQSASVLMDFKPPI